MARRCVVCTNETEGLVQWIDGIQVPVCVPTQQSVLTDDGQTHIPCVAVVDSIRTQIQDQLSLGSGQGISLELATLGQILKELTVRYNDIVVGVCPSSRDADLRTYWWGDRSRCHYLTGILQTAITPQITPIVLQ